MFLVERIVSMMLTRIILFLLLLLITSGFTLINRKGAMGQSVDSSTSSKKMPTVYFCDLVAHPELYENKIVRVRASYFANFESNLLYDLECNSKENHVWFMLDCDTDESCKAMRDILNKNLEGDPFSGMRVELVIVGQLKRPKSDHRQGMQNGFRLEFAVTRIEQAIPIPLNTPMPVDKPSSVSDEQEPELCRNGAG
jgi:hypothetical protein